MQAWLPNGAAAIQRSCKGPHSSGHHEKLINLPVCERVVRVPDLHLHLLLVPIIRFPLCQTIWDLSLVFATNSDFPLIS